MVLTGKWHIHSATCISGSVDCFNIFSECSLCLDIFKIICAVWNASIYERFTLKKELTDIVFSGPIPIFQLPFFDVKCRYSVHHRHLPPDAACPLPLSPVCNLSLLMAASPQWRPAGKLPHASKGWRNYLLIRSSVKSSLCGPAVGAEQRWCEAGHERWCHLSSARSSADRDWQRLLQAMCGDRRSEQ